MTTDRAETAPKTESGQKTAVYVYGIVPADVELEENATGVGDPPSEVKLVRQGEIAALVSEIPADRPLGTPADLTAHANLLDGVAAVAPVLPLRFGGVVSDTDAVAQELLAANEDQFRSALRELEGRAQFVVQGRYVEEAILGEVLAENPEASRLRDTIAGTSEDATRNARIELGKIINQALEAKRAKDTRVVINALEDLEPMVNQRPPTHEEDAVHIAILVEASRQGDLERALKSLGDQWGGRVDLTLLGPMAGYDFVVKPQPKG